jgi:uncharacterized protein DUF5916/cellulose/xylan binding protein with CBM9 domain
VTARQGRAIVVCFLVASAGVASPALAQQFIRPELHATRAVSPPIIDGVLNDEAWQTSPLETGEWLSYSPLNGDHVPQTTTVWLTFDDDYLYFAFKCDDPQPNEIKTSITRRDNIWNDDWVGLSLDALGTGQLSYHMMVNPSGVQLDLLNSVATNEDSAPDWLWDSAGRLTDTGYAVEVRLPLQSIRFNGGSNVRMGLMFFRRVSRLGVSVSWPPMPAGVWVFERHAALFFEAIQSQRVREILPSATFSHHQTLDAPEAWDEADQKADFGFSTKVGLTSTITLDATVNPDFSQVESDAFQVEVNQRFPIFFGEKRPFFMEGTGIFALAGTGNGDNSLRTAVHTRRIVDPSFGVKVTGSVGHLAFGGLAARDVSGDHDHFFSIGRAQYSFGPSNYVGALFTDTTSTVDGNRVAGMDLKYRVTATQRLDALALVSSTRAEGETHSRTGLGAQASYSYETDKWIAVGTGEHYGDDFDMATAFINRVGITGGWGYLNRSWYPDKTKYPWIRRVSIINFTKGGEDRLSGGGNEFFTVVGGQFNFTRQGFWRVQRTFGFEHWQGERFKNGGFSTFGSVQLFRWLAINGGYFSGLAVYYDPEEPFQGQSDSYNVGFTFQPSGRLSEELAIDHIAFNREATGERVYTVTVINSKTTYQFTRALALRGQVQYDSSRNRILTDSLFSYEPRPGTVVYAGYGSLIERRDYVNGEWIPLTGDYRTTERGLFFKASYLYRF